MEMVIRSLTMDVFLFDEDKEKYYDILNSIKKFRHTARKLFAVVFAAQAAGADCEVKDDYFRVIPNNDEAKKILVTIFKPENHKAVLYECRDYVLKEYPGLYSFAWDSMRRTCWERWQARDPLLKLTRGYAVLNGVHRLAQLNYIGIQFPQGTAGPKIEAHSITFSWHHDIGPVRFKIPRLDQVRYSLWKRIVDGELESGSVILNEREGQFRISYAYHIPVKSSNCDKDSKMTVNFSDENQELFIRMSHGQSLDTLSAVNVVDSLNRLKMQATRFERDKAAVGDKHRPWSAHKPSYIGAQRKISRLTKRRANFEKTWNHLWTERIIARALAWKCGTIELGSTPKTESKSTIFGKPWQWEQFVTFLKYKAKEKSLLVMEGES